MTLVLAALAFTLSFDALRQLAIETGARPQFAWMAPVALDVAQAAATLALVVLGVADKYRRARRYCMGLATATVLLSVAGNSYHAYQLAAHNAARVAAGEDLGFIPQPPQVAAFIAAIYPLLWLALLHLFTIMLRAIKDETVQARSLDAATALAAAGATASDDAAVGGDRNSDSPSRWRITRESATEQHAPVAPSPMSTGDARRVAVVAAPTATDPANVVAAEQHQVAPQRRVGRAPAPAPVSGADVDATAAVVSYGGATRNGFPQDDDGLRLFLEASSLSAAVKRVAATRIDNPGYNQVQVAQELQLDKSTVSRHWRTFSTAAHDEGFTVPPLPQAFGTVADTASNREMQPA